MSHTRTDTQTNRQIESSVHVPALVHAYNSTRHKSTGLTPHYLMFKRHPRLAINAFLKIKPNAVKKSSSHSNYVQNLQKRLNFAYKVASQKSKKQARRHKKRYNLKVRKATLKPGNRVISPISLAIPLTGL
jgi:hypothetical protein